MDEPARLAPEDVALALLVEARAIATGEAAVRFWPNDEGSPSPTALVLGVRASLPVEDGAVDERGLELAERAVERAWAAHSRDTADLVAVFDTALEGLAASRRPSRRSHRPRELGR